MTEFETALLERLDTILAEMKTAREERAEQISIQDEIIHFGRKAVLGDSDHALHNE